MTLHQRSNPKIRKTLRKDFLNCIYVQLSDCKLKQIISHPHRPYLAIFNVNTGSGHGVSTKQVKWKAAHWTNWREVKSDQCTMRFPLLEIVNRKIQASSLIFFRFICFRQKYLKCTFDFFYIFGCELIAGPQASKFTKEPVAI